MSSARIGAFVHLAAILGLLASLGPAHAGDNVDWGTTTEPAGVFAGVSVYSGGFKGGRGSGCTYAKWFGDTALDGKTGAAQAAKMYGGNRHLGYNKLCPGDVPNLVTGTIGRFVWIYSPDPGGPVEPAFDYLEKLLVDPDAQFAPGADRGIVTVGQWFWAEGLPAKISVTAEVEFPRRFATVTATPSTLIFDSGEPGGQPVECAAPGEPWREEYGDDLPSDCMYTYRHSSAIADNGESFEASLTIEWTITVVTSEGRNDTLEPLRTSSSTSIVVKELQAIIVSGSDA